MGRPLPDAAEEFDAGQPWAAAAEMVGRQLLQHQSNSIAAPGRQNYNVRRGMRRHSPRLIAP